MIPQPYLIFEHPLNERIRTFLRTEHLFELAKYRFNYLNSTWDSRDCVATIIELYNLIERTEFRSELLKEIERNLNSLQRLSMTPTVDHDALQNTIDSLEETSEAIKSYSNRQGFFPKDCDLLNSLRQRLTIPGGTCSFDLPAFHYWLHLPAYEQQNYLNQWVEGFGPLEGALSFILDLTRQSSFATQEIAIEGSFQKTLSSQGTCQLLRIELNSNLGIYPEISAGKHRVNIRFLAAQFDQGKALSLNEDIPFTLTCCMM